VTFNGIPAPLSAVVPTGAFPLVNAQVPFEALPAGQTSGTANLVVTVNSVSSPPQSVPIVAAAPGVFTIPPTGQGNVIFAFIDPADNTAKIAAPASASASIGYPTAPVPIGQSGFFYATGLGAMTPPISDGAADLTITHSADAMPAVMVGGVTAQVQFAGQAPGFPGVNQINIVIPSSAPTGDAVPLQVQTADGKIISTPGATIAVGPRSTKNPQLESLTLIPASVVGGVSVTATLTLSGPAATSGAQVTLSSNNSSVQVPPSETIASEQSSATFTIATMTVASTQTATITASLGASTVTAVLTVSPGGGSVSVSITEYPVPTNSVFINATGNPYGITAGPDGALWFTEGTANKIGRITTAGSFTEYPVPTPNSGLDPITAGPDGALWFTEGFAQKIGRITTSGLITEFPVPSSASPYGITAGPDGALWFTENLANNIGRITTSGVITEYPVPTANSQPIGITAGPDGALWFTESFGNPHNIGRITTTGMITEYSAATFGGPLWITAGPDGALWFTETNATPQQIGRITTTGVLTEYPVPTPCCDIIGITLGPDGALWFAEQTAGNIGRITTAGAITEYPLPSSLSGPYGITAGPDDTLWFTAYYANEIGRAALTTTAAITPTLQGLALSSTSITGGSSVTGTVTLAGPAPPGGVQITIQNSPAILQTNSSVTVLAGQTSATFTVGAPSVTSTTTVTITATLLGSSPVSASLTITPATATNTFENSGFDIYGTLTISGQTVPVEVQTLPLSDGTLGTLSNSGGSLIEIMILFDQQSSASGNTLTYIGADPASSYLNLSTDVLYSDFSAATLSITIPSPAVGATVNGALQFTSSGTTLSGTFTGKISTVSGP
jgi:virginiamycin B lyase